jgi:hypothetical protein
MNVDGNEKKREKEEKRPNERLTMILCGQDEKRKLGDGGEVR